MFELTFDPSIVQTFLFESDSATSEQFILKAQTNRKGRVYKCTATDGRNSVEIKNYMCDVGDQNCLDQYQICQTVFDLCDQLLEPQCKNKWCECKDFGK